MLYLQASIWHSHLSKSADRMRELAGGRDYSLGIDLDSETASLPSSVSREDLHKVASNLSQTTLDSQQPQSPMQVVVSLGEVALFVSGRPCKTWWPPEV